MVKSVESDRQLKKLRAAAGTHTFKHMHWFFSASETQVWDRRWRLNEESCHELVFHQVYIDFHSFLSYTIIHVLILMLFKIEFYNMHAM